MKRALFAMACLLAGAFALAHEYRKGDLFVFHPWTLPTEAGARSNNEYSRDGVHLWLSGLKSPLVVGQRIPLVLHFERAGEIEVEIGVQARPEPPREPVSPAQDPHAGHAAGEPHHH